MNSTSPDYRPKTDSTTNTQYGRATPWTLAHYPRASSSYRSSKYYPVHRRPHNFRMAHKRTSSPRRSATESHGPCLSYANPKRSVYHLAMPTPDSGNRCPSASHRSWPDGRAVCDACAFECDRLVPAYWWLGRDWCRRRLCGRRGWHFSVFPPLGGGCQVRSWCLVGCETTRQMRTNPGDLLDDDAHARGREKATKLYR